MDPISGDGGSGSQVEEASPRIPPTPESAPGPAAEIPRRAGRGWRLPALFFAVTCVTTLLTGVEFEAPSRGIEIQSYSQILAQPSLLLLGLPYALSILAILGTHEMGHYVACRRYGIDATPPYFLPSPPGLLFGTFGAFIRIRAPITDRRALFDIGVAGPLAGFAVAIPVMIVGVMTSAWRPDLPSASGLYLGDCLFTRLLTAWLVAPPPEPTGYVFAFGSIAMAGWVGLLATALNLLPVGQLDGGHIAYAVSGRFHTFMSRLCLVAFVVMGLRINESWLFWATVLIFLSPRHPALLDESRRLSPARLMVAALAAIVLVISFIPSPIRPVP
jgi:membrane-associated protease RseP (regulator of RpoE activity)